MPELYRNDKKHKLLFSQRFRCTGCHYCIEVCKSNALQISPVRNSKLKYPPIIKQGGSCSFCRNCELICPNQAIYVVEENNG